MLLPLQHYSKIYENLDGAKIDFGAIEAALQQTFYPGITKADMAKIQGLSGGQVAIVSNQKAGRRKGILLAILTEL